ncbi:hypothetical protein [Dethiobacter alkaliphilus]|uniref:Uncharacterized protein n=1 Tax=Dethiobacter alkaliphilus AHT 1 TaxID=555088 RepID=C0GE71_DETAL|nr:hypothetical protein [Dethiobacter alkaliphilus]EEG78365.1 hypothetical protein DealDRAFT_0780 [Dethiobacter alkaliphilus AHT 1]
MAIHVYPDLMKVPGWKEMKGYAEESMAKCGFKDYLVIIRPATSKEEQEWFNDGTSAVAEFDDHAKILELVFGVGEIMTLEEMKNAFESKGVDINDGELIRVWAAQGNLEDPRIFAEANVVDMLAQYIEAYEGEEE